MTATTNILSVERIKKIAKGVRAFVQNTFESKIPLKIMQDVISAGFGFARWDDLRAACERGQAVSWDRRSFARSMDACSDSNMPKAATEAMVLLVERLLDQGPNLSEEVNSAILRFPFDDGKLTDWAHRLQTLVRRAGFADLVGFAIGRASDRLASADIADDNERYMEMIWEAMQRDPDGMTDHPAYAAAQADLDHLGARPAHPAWPAVVLAALSLTVTPHAREHMKAITERRATAETILFGTMAFGFTAYGEDVPLDERLSGLDASLGRIAPNQAADFRETVYRTLGAALLEMRLSYLDAGFEPPDLAAMSDLDRPAVVLPPDGDPASDGVMEDDDLGAPAARGWLPLRRPSDGMPLEGQWHRVLVDGDEAEAILARIDPQQERKSPHFGDFSTGPDASRTAHVVGFGAYPDAVAPALMVVTTRFVKEVGARTVVTVAIEDVLAGPGIPDTGIEGTFYSLHETAKADVERLNHVVEESGEKGGIRVEYALAPFATPYQQLLDLMEAFTFETEYDATRGHDGTAPGR